MLSQKCQYALRATFELAKNYGKGPVKIADIARAQSIPVRFLEVILNQLKQGGFVRSQRGNEGGYMLVRAPDELTVGDIIGFMHGPVGPVDCVLGEAKRTNCEFYGSCVFLPMWKKVEKAISDVYDSTTLRDLVEEERNKEKGIGTGAV